MIAKKFFKNYFAGFDIGSDTVHAIVLDENKNIIYAPESLMHFGNQIDALIEIYKDITNHVGENNVVSTAFTGSAGKLIAEVTNTTFYYDTISIPTGAEIIAPTAEYIFHMGSKDPYFFEKGILKGKSFVIDHATGTKCGGGSGILINKQVRRFFVEEHPVELEDIESEKIKSENRKKLQLQLEHMHRTSFETIKCSSKDIDVGGRCGVVIQSDMIHLQNSGEQIPNILKGMYVRVTQNYRSDVIKTRQLDREKKSIVTGGVFFNEFMIDALSKELGISLERPVNFEKIGAVGAALKALRGKEKSRFNVGDLKLVIESQRREIQYAPSLSSVLNRVHIYPEEEAVRITENGLVIYKQLREPTDIVIGVDGGSTTTKALIADADNLDIIAEICLDTEGRPLETAQKIFREIKTQMGNYIKINGICYTGSSGAFYHRLFTDFKINPEVECADIVKDEITCHAFGVKHFNNKVDTIFECGGQDAKYTRFNKDGTVKKAKMNLSCMAGTGQSMKNMLDMLGFDFNDFRRYALKATRTPIVDETCAIFTEAGILKLLALGFSKEELAAATAYGFMGGYANKFVGNESFGDFASGQGGPFKGIECLAALILHTDIEIHAFPHRQLFGALGAAIAIFKRIEEMKKSGKKYECKFRGLDISDMKFQKRVESCTNLVEDSCGRDCKLQVYKLDKDEIFSGGLCPKGNIDLSLVEKTENYVELYKKMLKRKLDAFNVKYVDYKIGIVDNRGNRNRREKPQILIPRSFTYLNEKGVFYTALYYYLGFDVVISPESDDYIANLGNTHSHSEACYPAKLANGHAALLTRYLRKGIDKLLLVNTISVTKDKKKFCPYVSAAGFVAKDALGLDNKDVLLPVLHFEDPNYRIEDAIYKDLRRIYKGERNGWKFSKNKVKKAVLYAEKAQREFLEEIYSRGESIIEKLKKKGEKIFIGIGRGYTVLDDKASSKIHELFISYGLNFVPSFFLRRQDIDISNIAHHMYWYQGQNIIQQVIRVALDPKLYGVRETNFNCGTDSMILYHEQRVMEIAEKPYLVLQTDGHNSNAQFGTRTLANNEVVKTHKSRTDLRIDDFKVIKPGMDDLEKRILGIPDMGRENTEILVAVFKSIGYKTELMPSRTEKSRYFARKVLNTNICEPMSFVTGDSLAWLYEKSEQGFIPNRDLAIFMPQAAGPCRFGQYHVLLRNFCDSDGFTGVPIVSPASQDDYYDVPVSRNKLNILKRNFFKALTCNDTLQNALLRTRPYEINKGETERTYKELHRELLSITIDGCSMKKLDRFMGKAINIFEDIPKYRDTVRKRVDMIGEIFVRLHPKANQDSLKMLESTGLEVYLPMSSDWFYYINQNSKRKFLNDKKYNKLLKSFIKGYYMNYVKKRLSKPFKIYLSGREPHDILGLIRRCQSDMIYHIEIEGESPISIGEAYEFIHGHINTEVPTCGIYHVLPFGCMQETTATSKIQSLIQNKRISDKEHKSRLIPYLTAVFGESELPNLEAEIAAFAEKCNLKRELEASSMT